MKSIHAAARAGFSTAAQAYGRGRPDYPRALEGWLADRLGLRPGRASVDLGAGTGKCTALMLRTGSQVTAIEPIAPMRAQLALHCPGATVLEGTAEEIPLADASVDAVVCAQSFHWFASRASLAEIHRVLKPGGRLGLVWNVRDETIDWVAAITAIITPYEGDAPRFYQGTWREAFAAAPFSPLLETRFAYQHVGPPEEVIIDRILSVSFIAALPEPERARVASKLQALIDTHPALKGHATLAFPYETRAYHCAPLAEAP